MQLPQQMREDLVDELDDYFEAVAKPSAEAVVNYLLELLETMGEDAGLEEVVSGLEEDGAIDGSLSDVLEEEMESNDEFTFTGEEVVSLLERISGVVWADDDGESDDEDDEDDEDDDF